MFAHNQGAGGECDKYDIRRAKHLYGKSMSAYKTLISLLTLTRIVKILRCRSNQIVIGVSDVRKPYHICRITNAYAVAHLQDNQSKFKVSELRCSHGHSTMNHCCLSHAQPATSALAIIPCIIYAVHRLLAHPHWENDISSKLTLGSIQLNTRSKKHKSSPSCCVFW
jgi:hypothetical protein